MRREVVVASTVAFIASFCTLVIELVAGRILAPYLGVSLYTWTTIIGVVLAGISFGAYLGGMLADRYPHYGTLGWLLFLSGLTSLSIPFVTDLVSGAQALAGSTSLLVRIMITTSAIFLPPAIILGMISPVVIKLTVKNLEETGNTVGRIYAFSTLGSILGTFATGFYLIELLGTRTVLYCVGTLLIFCAPIFGGLFAQSRALRPVVVGLSLFLLAAALGSIIYLREVVAMPINYYWLTNYFPDLKDRIHPPLQDLALYKESSYYTIRVREQQMGEETLQILLLDNLIHSFSHKQDPFYLKYDYLRIYEELVAWRRSQDQRANRFLFIGGGGYTLPRYFDHAYPNADIDVVEIDPVVTQVAYEHLGVDKTRIRSHNMDGRWFVMNCQDQYDFVFGDAFNDLSIPYHLTTREFDEQLKGILKPDGLLMALVIDSVQRGQFLPTYLHTLREVFGPRNVVLVTAWDSDLNDIGQHTCIVVASHQPLDIKSLETFLTQRLARHRAGSNAAAGLAAGLSSTQFTGLGGLSITPWVAFPGGKNASRVHGQERLNSYLASRQIRPIILKDDHCPVDNLTAPMFEERFGFKKE
jgi:spermidine synthase